MLVTQNINKKPYYKNRCVVHVYMYIHADINDSCSHNAGFEMLMTFCGL